MEFLQILRIVAAFILFGLFVIVGGCNWWYVGIGLHRKFSKSSERVPSMSFIGWVFLILGSIIYPPQAAPRASPIWLFVIPIIDPSIAYMILGLFVLLPYSFARRLLGKSPQL